MSPRRILVVDDEPGILKSVQLILEQQYTVVLAHGGKEAIEILKREEGKFDVVLMDLSMPEVNGPQLYLHIMENYPGLETHVVFMTGGAFGGFIEEFGMGETNPVVNKPFTSSELREVIGEAVKRLEKE